MRRPLILILLLLSGASPLFAELGRLVDKEKVVEKSLQGKPFKPMEKNEVVEEDLTVRTGEGSGAKFALGEVQGAVTMGPSSRFRFRKATFDGGFDFSVEFGKFLFAIIPKLLDDESKKVLGAWPGEVVIVVNAVRYSLQGTAIYLIVEPSDRSTSLYVLEGRVKVTREGEPPFFVEAGQRIVVPAEGPPSLPSRFDPSLPGPDAERILLKVPTELLIPGPLVDWGDPRLDLPR